MFIKNSRIYNFEENKQGFDGKSRTLTHFAALEEQYSGQSIKCLAKRSRLSLADSVVQFAVPIGCDSQLVKIFFHAQRMNNLVHLVEVRLLGNLNSSRRHAQSMTPLRQQQ